MISPATSQSTPFSPDHQIWENLKDAIAASSGFQRWQMECPSRKQLAEDSLDCSVRRYLRETLETLAY